MVRPLRVSQQRTDDEHFKCTVNVAVSSQFLSWILAFGNRAKIISPDSVAKQLIQLIDDVKNAYN